jgi:hypothetical protein
MKHLFAIVLTAGSIIGGASAYAQVLPQIPDLQNPIPAPLPEPLQPPIINGPLSQSPPPGVATPQSMNTFSDRALQCLQEGSAGGLSGGNLDTYTSQCAN